MTQVATLRFDELVRIDQDRLMVLYVELGEAGAEAFVCRAMDELAGLLAQMEAQFRAGQTDALCRNARAMARASGEIGMTTLARVSRDLIDRATLGDRPGLGAVWARLLRICDRSLLAVRDQRDLSV